MNSKGMRQTNAMSLQINHERWEHHPGQLYRGINNNFIKKIEDREDPSSQYRNKMKGIYMDQLQKGVDDFSTRKSHQNEIKCEIRKDYKEKLNGVLSQLEKNELNRKIYYERCMNRQQQKKRRFIDSDKIKGNKINDLVQKNIDSDKFYHFQDYYKQLQKQQFNRTKLIRDWQLFQHHKKKQIQLENKQNAKQLRLEQQNTLALSRKLEGQARKQNQKLYYDDLSKLVQEKSKKFPEIQTSKPSKHNPITNPIQYHIDNPYILRKMQKKYSQN